MRTVDDLPFGDWYNDLSSCLHIQHTVGRCRHRLDNLWTWIWDLVVNSIHLVVYWGHTVFCMEDALSFAWEGGRECVCVHVVRVCDADWVCMCVCMCVCMVWECVCVPSYIFSWRQRLNYLLPPAPVCERSVPVRPGGVVRGVCLCQGGGGGGGSGERSVHVPGWVARGVCLSQGEWWEECACPRGSG